ncbi:MAG: ArsC family reductase [Rhodocyclales bacterium]|nr:ArsC family reductase [Rhodocyclales bacterium]
MTITIYGIKSCSTMKKAFDWLDRHGVAYAFHDYKKAGADRATLESWCAAVSWEALLNMRGTTWRKLDPAQQDITDEAAAIALMCEHSSVIRRPVIEIEHGELLVGFDPVSYAARLAPDGVPT